MSDAATIAHILLKIKAVTFNLETPYLYTSGLQSPIYCDNRLILSFPEYRRVLIDAFVALVKKTQLTPAVIAGVATAGIPHAAWLADRLNIPMVYVKAQAKLHGQKKQIEGQITKNEETLIVEDLISTGGSAIHAASVLRSEQVIVNHCIAIFTYDLPSALINFEKAHLTLHALCHLHTLLEVAEKRNYLNAKEKNMVLTWQKDPSNWRK